MFPLVKNMCLLGRRKPYIDRSTKPGLLFAMFCCSSRDDAKENRPRPGPPQAVHGHHSSTPPQGAGKPVGVGIVFQPDSTGALHVKSLAVGGPAEKSGQISIGDVLHEIDGHHVYRKPVAHLAPLILGQEGTSVRLGVQRGNLQRLVYVELRRGWSMNPQQGGAPVAAGAQKTWSHPLPQGARLSHFSGPDGQMTRESGQ